MAVQKQDDQHEHTFSSYVRIRDVVLKAYLGRWTIGGSGKRVSGISVLPARHEDDDDIYIYIYDQIFKWKDIVTDISWRMTKKLVKNTYGRCNLFVYISSSSSTCRAATLTLSRHFSLSFIASGRSSGLHPVSSLSCYMYFRAGRPAFAWPYAGVHRSTSLMSSSLLLQLCPACLVRLTWIVFVMVAV